MNKPSEINRRTALQVLGFAAAGLSGIGKAGSIFVVGDACPPRRDDPADIDWIPDVMHPVGAGFAEYTTAQGAPSLLRVWYPTYDISLDKRTRPILKHCIARYPVVLFMHGHPPCGRVLGDGYFRRWDVLPADLARSGYVVVVPEHTPHFEGDLGVPFAASCLDWVRTKWEHAQWVDKRPEQTAIIGHSLGALESAQVAFSIGTIRACVFLSGVWNQFTSGVERLQALDRPMFFAWGDNVQDEDLAQMGWWSQLPGTRYGAHFPGQHFDYIDAMPDCNVPRGPCELIQPAMADLATLFIARNIPPAGSTTVIPHTLIPPATTLTTRQQQYAASRLVGLERIRSSVGCAIELEWFQGWIPFRRHIGP